jgi:hypothetical protein
MSTSKELNCIGNRDAGEKKAEKNGELKKFDGRAKRNVSHGRRNLTQEEKKRTQNK